MSLRLVQGDPHSLVSAMLRLLAFSAAWKTLVCSELELPLSPWLLNALSSFVFPSFFLRVSFVFPLLFLRFSFMFLSLFLNSFRCFKCEATMEQMKGRWPGAGWPLRAYGSHYLHLGNLGKVVALVLAPVANAACDCKSKGLCFASILNWQANPAGTHGWQALVSRPFVRRTRIQKQ